MLFSLFWKSRVGKDLEKSEERIEKRANTKTAPDRCCFVLGAGVGLEGHGLVKFFAENLTSVTSRL